VIFAALGKVLERRAFTILYDWLECGVESFDAKPRLPAKDDDRFM
jgi:hypothetical protein